MGYRSAAELLPADLLREVQRYIHGDMLYIPRLDDQKKSWGEVSGARQATQQRNREIQQKYQNGISVQALSEHYYLSPKTIYKILKV